MIDTKYHQVIRGLSEKIVAAQRPIRILDALKWNGAVEEAFFKSGCKELPNVRGPEFYTQNPLKFDPDKKIDEFNQIEREIRRELGQFNSVGAIMQRMCREYCTVVEMLNARGTPHFTRYAQQLYGSADDAFYAGAPTLTDLALLISSTLSFIEKQTGSELDQKIYTSDEAFTIWGNAYRCILRMKRETRVKLSDDIIADAAAGAGL